MSRVQVIELDGKRGYVVPADIWERVKALVAEAEDMADVERFDREDDGVRIPAPVAFAIADGAHPIKAWREHKAMTQQALADAAGLSKPFLSQIEGGKRVGSAATLRKIATALGVPIGALL